MVHFVENHILDAETYRHGTSDYCTLGYRPPDTEIDIPGFEPRLLQMNGVVHASGQTEVGVMDVPVLNAGVTAPKPTA